MAGQKKSDLQPTSYKLTLPCLDDFLLNMQTNNYSAETIYNYECDLKTFLNFLQEVEASFEKIDKKTILNYKAYLASHDRKTAGGNDTEKHLSSYTTNRMLSALRSYFKYLIEMDYDCPVAPDMIKLAKTDKKHLRLAEFEDIVKLIEFPNQFEQNEIVASRNRAMLETLFSTGMRISELLNLKIAQIDKTGRIFIKGKGRKERFVYLTKRSQKYLNDYLTKREIGGEYLFLPLRGKNSAKKNKKVSTNYLQERIKHYRELLGINTPISAHSLRHAFATLLAEQGANPAAIQILLGHESLQTTTRYVNVSDRYAEDAHKKFHPLSA
ncbi:MAG: tyrosine-type recombinase/integrase [Candidatus Falkowbacteria bacterium]